MIRGFKVITLCGSTRFKDEFIETQKKLTLEGYIVLSVNLFTHSSDDKVFEGMTKEAITNIKKMFDDMHICKIDLSDGIYIINPGGYIGESTKKEIKYAIIHKKEIRSLEPVDLISIYNEV